MYAAYIIRSSLKIVSYYNVHTESSLLIKFSLWCAWSRIVCGQNLSPGSGYLKHTQLDFSSLGTLQAGSKSIMTTIETGSKCLLTECFSLAMFQVSLEGFRYGNLRRPKMILRLACKQKIKCRQYKINYGSILAKLLGTSKS